MRGRSALVGAALTLLLAGGVPSPAWAGTPRLPCSARMSNAHPYQNHTTNVLVASVAQASVTTVAHYRTTNTAHTARTNSRGRASIAYRVSRATAGYRVVVSVTVRRSGRTGTCSTWFTPRPNPQPAPAPASPNICGAPSNPWGYNFCGAGPMIYNPPSNVCTYFSCINSFWNGVGYMEQCSDGMFSLSGGRQGACSYHGGEHQPVYAGSGPH